MAVGGRPIIGGELRLHGRDGDQVQIVLYPAGKVPTCDGNKFTILPVGNDDLQQRGVFQRAQHQ